MIKPARGYILVEQIDDALEAKGGFILPESSKDKPIKGLIVEIGLPIRNLEGIEIAPDNYKVGDKVIYKKWSTTDLEEDGKKLSFVAFGDILGVYE